MNLNDLPKFTGSAYSTSTTSAANLMAGSNIANVWQHADNHRDAYAQAFHQWTAPYQPAQAITITGATSMSAPVIVKSKLRVVRVFLVDPDERVPLDKRILHRTEEMTTDAVDQELFHEIPVVQLLKEHNELRRSIKWKEEGSKGDAEPLKEIRIRDLVMSVTTVASF